jgi:outer membrane protein
VKSTKLVLPALGLAWALSLGAQTSGKVGVINIQSAIVSTNEGKKAANEIQSRFNPKKTEVDKRQSEISQLQDQLNRGRNTLSEEARATLVRDIDQKTKSLKYFSEDAQAELNQEEQKAMNELGGRMMSVIDKYAKDNGYTLILDVSSSQAIMYASNTIDITRDIIDLYDKSATPASSVSAAPRAAEPSAPAPVSPAKVAPNPAAPPK